MKVTARTRGGGAVKFSSKHGVWASYKVAGVADLPTPEIFYAGAKLPDGRRIQFFLNRETNLVVVDVIDRSGRSGTEIVRRKV